MVLSIILLLVFLGVAMFQMVQGFFSSLLMAVLTICCAALAIGYYEYVAIKYVAGYWRADYALAISLALLFGVPLILMRLGFDKAVPRSPLIPSWLDKGGGAVCGLITGLIISGMIALTLQLIPFNGSTLGYRRVAEANDTRDEKTNEVAEPPELREEEPEILLTPNRFVVATVAHLSDGVFQGSTSLSAQNPDMVQAIGWLASTPSEVTRYAPSGAIEILGVGEVDQVYLMAEGNAQFGTSNDYKPEEKLAGTKYQAVRVKFKESAKNAKKSIWFSPLHFRLEGIDTATKKRMQVRPLAIQTYDPLNPNRHFARYTRHAKHWPMYDRAYEPLGPDKDETELVFEVPETFQPEFLEFKRGARVKWPETGSLPNLSVLHAAAAAAAPPPGEPQHAADGRELRGGRGGNVRGATTISGQSFFGDALPTTLTKYTQNRNVTIAQGKLNEGHITAIGSEQDGGPDLQISSFTVPSDKRLLHLNVKNLQAKSTLGKALMQAVKSVQNYKVIDDSGREYKVIGKYAVATIDGQETIEIQYFPEQVGSIGGLAAFTKIQERHLESNYEFVLLFLVDPGVKIVSFSTGGSATRADDLSSDNLVAPQ